MKKILSVSSIVLVAMVSINLHALTKDANTFNELLKNVEALAAGEGDVIVRCDTQGWGQCYVIDKPYNQLNWDCDYTGTPIDHCPKPL